MASIYFFIFNLFIVWQYWGLNSGSHTQCHTSQVPNPFGFRVLSVCFAVFSDRVLHFCLGPRSSYLCLPCSWDYRCVSPHLAKDSFYLLRTLNNPGRICSRPSWERETAGHVETLLRFECTFKMSKTF
jgi:hypothetical protein